MAFAVPQLEASPQGPGGLPEVDQVNRVGPALCVVVDADNAGIVGARWQIVETSHASGEAGVVQVCPAPRSAVSVDIACVLPLRASVPVGDAHAGLGGCDMVVVPPDRGREPPRGSHNRKTQVCAVVEVR